MKMGEKQPTRRNKSTANIMIFAHPPNNPGVIRESSRLLRHVNAGTLAVVMMVSLALLKAEQQPTSTAGKPAVNNTMAAGIAINRGNSELDTATHPSGFYRLGERPTVGPCPGLSRASVCLP
jgi:hypothetical protein